MEKWWCDLHRNIKLFAEQTRVKAFKLRSALWNCLHESTSIPWALDECKQRAEPSTVEKPTNWKCSNNHSWLSRAVDSLMASSHRQPVRWCLFSVEFHFLLHKWFHVRTLVRHAKSISFWWWCEGRRVRGRVKYCRIFHYHTTKCVCTRRYWEKANETKCRKWLLTISQATANSIHWHGDFTLNNDYSSGSNIPEAGEEKTNYASFSGRVFTCARLKDLSPGKNGLLIAYGMRYLHFQAYLYFIQK